jgi:hypothetical protein
LPGIGVLLQLLEVVEVLDELVEGQLVQLARWHAVEGERGLEAC